jgi:hypothetical protein
MRTPRGAGCIRAKLGGMGWKEGAGEKRQGPAHGDSSSGEAGIIDLMPTVKGDMDEDASEDRNIVRRRQRMSAMIKTRLRTERKTWKMNKKRRRPGWVEGTLRLGDNAGQSHEGLLCGVCGGRIHVDANDVCVGSGFRPDVPLRLVACVR